ncbi:hypothetical protein [Ancylobacter moscoviensis]
MASRSTVRALVGAVSVPANRTVSREERAAYIAATAKPATEFGVGVFLPYIGGAFFGWNHIRTRAFANWSDVLSIQVDRWGSIEFWSGRAHIQADLPDGAYTWPNGARLAAHVPWLIVCLPLLLIALLARVVVKALTAPLVWRVKRLALRFAWVVVPDRMNREAALWCVEQEAYVEYMRTYEGRCAAEDAAREAKREAAFETEVERRLALRLAAAGA